MPFWFPSLQIAVESFAIFTVRICPPPAASM
jgi:hypothetical protein